MIFLLQSPAPQQPGEANAPRSIMSAADHVPESWTWASDVQSKLRLKHSKFGGNFPLILVFAPSDSWFSYALWLIREDARIQPQELE